MDITIPRPQDLPYLNAGKAEGSLPSTLSVSEHARILHSACRRAEPDKWGKDLPREFKSLEVIIRGWQTQEWTTCSLCQTVRGLKLSESSVIAKNVFGTAFDTPPLGNPETLMIPGEWVGENGETITFPDKFVGCAACINEIKRQTAELIPKDTDLPRFRSGEFAGYPILANPRDRAELMDIFGGEYYLRNAEWYAKRERFIALNA